MTESVSHWPDVRDKPAFLHRLMFELAGDAYLSLEGDLTNCDFADDFLLSRNETNVLKRSTIYPRQDFVILRLTPDSIIPIFQRITVAGLNTAILHIQIERAGILELGAYDNFHPECVVTGPSVSAELLEELKSKHIIRDFFVASDRSHD